MLHKPADVVPVPADDIVPVPADNTDILPCRSGHPPAPSTKAAENLGIKSIPRVAQAVIESREAGRRLKEQRTQAKFERRQQVLDLRASLTNIDNVQTPSLPTNAVPDDTLLPLINLDSEADFIAFCEAYASELAFPLINTHCPDEPTFREAMKSPDSAKWTLGIQDELKSLKEMGVYKLVPHSDIPAGRKILRGKWVLILKRDELGDPVRHKACFVALGYEQIFGQDYGDTTSPIARMESVRLLLNIAAAKDWDIQQIDVKTAFLYGLLPADEAQYLEQPESFEEPGKEDWVWCLQRGLYGMKQSGRIWNKIDWKVMLWAAVSFSALNLNRGNLTQANTDNFLPDLKLTTNDYNLGNTIFRLCFLIAELPSQLVSKRLGPDRWTPIQICLWSIVTLAQFWLTGRSTFLLARALLGFIQGGFIPDLILYLSYFYTKSELPFRLALFWMSMNVCSIVGGFVAFGVLRMRGVHGKAGWRWLFLVEHVTIPFQTIGDVRRHD